MRFLNSVGFAILVWLRQESNAFILTDPKRCLSPMFSSSLDDGSTSPYGYGLSKAEVKEEKMMELFPEKWDTVLERIDGGTTIRSCKLPEWATRVLYRVESFGRPVRGEVKLWLGPLRETHTLKFDNENGVQFPIQSVLKFKKGPPVLRVATSSDPNCPMKVSATVPSPDRAKELEKNTEKLFHGAGPDEKKTIQGGMTNKKGGAWVYWKIPTDVESVQLIGWSINTGRKSFKAQIELLHGPNNLMQSYFLQCGGGSQPYHTVFQTPGEGWVVRVQNKKFMEDGLVQMCVLPYETTDPGGKNFINWN